MRYVNLYRNKWVASEPEQIEVRYYEGEIDKKGNELSDETFDYLPVLFSEKNPNRQDPARDGMLMSVRQRDENARPPAPGRFVYMEPIKFYCKK